MAEPRSGTWLATACKYVLVFRALALLLTVLDAPDAGRVPLLGLALIAAAIASYVPLRHWDRVAGALMRRPLYLALEVGLAAVILVLTGTDSPFFLFTLGTAALGGLVYGTPGALLFAALLGGAYTWVFSLRADLERLPDSFQAVIGQPVLYLAAGLAGAAGRRLFERQDEAAATAQQRTREAAAERERARLARDMHDSLAKSLHGLSLGASALALRIARDPDGAAADARLLAADAETTAREARGLIHGLRAEETGPLAVTVAAHAAAFAQRSGLPVDARVDEDVAVGPAARHELVSILDEALRNVERHADARAVRVALVRHDDDVALTVGDDGTGFAQRGEDDLCDELHFGLVGMRERAALVGGRLEVRSAPEHGTQVTAVVPAGPAVAEPAEGATR